MANVGLLPEGFVPATMADIRAEIEEELRSEFGRSLPLGDGTLLGHLVGILAERLALLWEAAEAVNSSQDPDAATGAALEVLCLLTATFRIAAGASTSELIVAGDDGSIVTSGFTAATDSTGKKFVTAVDATIIACDAWGAGASYAVGDRVANSGNCYQCIDDGIADPMGTGPATTDDDIVDGTVHWTWIGEGDGVADVIGVCDENGAVFAAARDITEIITPVGGVNTVINLADANEGRLDQTDESLRLLREGELAQPGAGTADAIRAALLALSGVTNATVFFNNSDTTDDDGLSPHSTEILVQGGDDQEIFQAIWDNVPVGILTIGDEVGVVQDTEGFDQTVKFSRPEEKPIYIALDLEYYSVEYDGDATIKQAIVEWGDALSTGRDITSWAVGAQCARVDGVLNVTNVFIGLAPAPVSGATIPITRRQLALFDTSRITLNTTPGEP